MRIKRKIEQHRRDFSAVMVCEHCGHESVNKTGYDDAYYHQVVIPGMVCTSCRKTGSEPTSVPDVPAGVVL